MTEHTVDTDIDTLLEEYGSPDEIYDAVMESAPQLPDRVQHMDPWEIRDYEYHTLPDDQLESLLDWLIYQRCAMTTRKKAREISDEVNPTE